MSRRTVASIGIVAALLAGCAMLDKLNPFSSSGPKIKAAELAPIQATDSFAVLWQANVGAAGDYVFTPAVVGDSVYAAGHDGTLARFDAGREVWRVSVGQKLAGGVGADERVVAVGTPKGEVLAFDAATGKPLWQARVSSEVLAAPALGAGLVVVRSGDARVVGLDAADGKRRWIYQRATPALTLRSNVGVLFTERVVVAGFPGGKLVALNSKNGAAIWEVTVALPKGATELERVADITSSPVVAGKEICAAAFQGRVACFDIASGNQLWARDISSSAGLDIDDKHVYVSDDKGAVHALSRESGASIWKQDKLAMRGLTRPISLGRRVAVADFQGVAHLLNTDDGSFTARVATDGSAVVAEPQLVKGGFVVQTQKGSVVALGSR
jgi:outer membrane protein assembly factor BamB